MSANLDRSLDEIIGTNKKQIVRKTNKKAPKKVSKQIVGNRRGGPVSAVRQRAAPVKAANALEQAYGTKVSVEGLPRDIKQDAVREFFTSQVGGVARILLSYNERGLSTGMATITFKNAEKAREAVKKFHGAPIDGGRSKLRLSLIVDPSKKPLASRIQAIAERKPVPARGPNKKVAAVKQQKKEGKKPKPKPSPKAKPEKKSLEQLDQEMADYFEEKKIRSIVQEHQKTHGLVNKKL
ncbi:LANO_0H21770g1_1 [Lachancea nothofagi CBS 11611]|uniref:LANO_0H21770g1_1 n=1 Tax=Lachancea nothofagi CBS 11611 TaxID=1266666 RepID=A0A1G4KNF6_9SACH|nr:LANO_0H21770g1_1 [Lachancea nothofagi CBS 11611]